MYESRPKEGTPLDSAIVEMDVLAEAPEVKALADKVKISFAEVKEKLESGLIDADTACRFLFDLCAR